MLHNAQPAVSVCVRVWRAFPFDTRASSQCRQHRQKKHYDNAWAQTQTPTLPTLHAFGIYVHANTSTHTLDGAVDVSIRQGPEKCAHVLSKAAAATWSTLCATWQRQSVYGTFAHRQHSIHIHTHTRTHIVSSSRQAIIEHVPASAHVLRTSIRKCIHTLHSIHLPTLHSTFSFQF